MDFKMAEQEDGERLAEIRAAAMRPSLEAVGRFDEQRVRNRFLDTFLPMNTFKIESQGSLAGFFVITDKMDHLYLDHLYIHPDYPNHQLGRAAIEQVIKTARERTLPLRLGALRGSRSNRFYINHGFIKTHEDEFDIYYELRA